MKYGGLGVAVHYSIHILCTLAFTLLLYIGVAEHLPWLREHLGSGGTSFVGGYLLSKAIQVPRVGATLALTPLVARWLGRAPKQEPLAVERAPD